MRRDQRIPTSTHTAVKVNTEVMACLWDFHLDGYWTGSNWAVSTENSCWCSMTDKESRRLLKKKKVTAWYKDSKVWEVLFLSMLPRKRKLIFLGFSFSFLPWHIILSFLSCHLHRSPQPGHLLPLDRHTFKGLSRWSHLASVSSC